MANESAALVRQVFRLRADGASYTEIENRTGIKYSTARAIVLSRIYLGEVVLNGEWFPGRHEPIVSEAEWNAAHRAHSPGRRTGSDVLCVSR